MEERKKKEAIEQAIKFLEEVKEQNNYAITVIASGKENTASLAIAKDANLEQMATTYVELKKNLDTILKEFPALKVMEKLGLLEE